MISEEEEREMHEAMDHYYDALKKKWDQDKELVKDLIHPKYFDFIENQESYYSEGILETEEFEPTRTDHPNHKHCKVVSDKTDLHTYILTTDEIETFDNSESKYEGEIVGYWVWQTGYDDSYSGYMLFELSNGKYWKVGYSC